MNDHMRFATLEDAQAILDIYTPYVLTTSISFEEVVPSLDEFKQRMQTVLETYPWIVYLRQGRIIGYAYASAFNPRSAYDWTIQTSVYLDESSIGLGIGNRLYVALLDCLSYLGYVNAVALIVSPNEKSEKLHRSLSFKPGPLIKRIGYKLGSWHDLHWFVLALREHSDHPNRPKPLRDVERYILEQRLLTLK